MNKQVNIIIPVHNRLEHTKQTLESLIKNTDSKLYNLYIVNDHSDTETSTFIADFFKNLEQVMEIYLLYTRENIGPGASRNWACSLIAKEGRRGDYLYHSDNDVYFTEGWLSKMLVAYPLALQRDIKVLGGSCHPYLQNKQLIALHNDYVLPHSHVGIKDAVSGYSQFMSWEVWDKYGPFDETMRNAEKKIMGSEDWAFCQKIVQDGFKVGSIEPEVVIPCGKTNTYNEPATGSETFKNFPGVKVL